MPGKPALGDLVSSFQLSKSIVDVSSTDFAGPVDGSGDSKGFGKKSEGGMISDLPNDTVLTESDVLIGV